MRDCAPGIFHVTAHSVRSTELFTDALDRVSFLSELARMLDRYSWECLAFCLMTTHYHLLVGISDESLPYGMQRLNFRYAGRFNTRHRLRGHVFESRYGATRVESDGHLLAAFRYVARNPLEAGLCERAELWPWGSYGALIGTVEPFTFVDPSRVLGIFTAGRDAARTELRQFVESKW